MFIRPSRSLFLMSLALGALSACIPVAGNSEDAVIDQDILASVVAATLQAETIQGGESGEAITDNDELAEASLLPHSVFYLKSTEGIRQVWRMEPDGIEQHVVSPSNADISAYDVSPVDGSVAYVSENRLYLISAEGQEIRVLIDASSANKEADDYYYRNVISSPRFSGDGRTLAYGLNGIWLFDLDSGSSVHLLENTLEESDPTYIYPLELYFPESWSPDSENLLISVAYLEAGTLAFMNPEDGQMTALNSSGIVCCQSRWAPDNGSVLVASPYIGLIEPGLWRYDAATGAESIIIEGSDADSVFSFAGWPLQVSNGDIYYFYTSTAGFPDGDIPLLMVSSGPDGESERQQLRADSLIVREALWADDGSLALVVQSQQGTSGPLVLAKIDGSPLLILANEAEQLRWGP